MEMYIFLWEGVRFLTLFWPIAYEHFSFERRSLLSSRYYWKPRHSYFKKWFCFDHWKGGLRDSQRRNKANSQKDGAARKRPNLKRASGLSSFGPPPSPFGFSTARVNFLEAAVISYQKHYAGSPPWTPPWPSVCIWPTPAPHIQRLPPGKGWPYLRAPRRLWEPRHIRSGALRRLPHHSNRGFHEFYFSIRRDEETTEKSKEGCLPCTVRSNHADNLSWHHIERHHGESPQSSELPGKVLCLKQWWLDGGRVIKQIKIHGVTFL